MGDTFGGQSLTQAAITTTPTNAGVFSSITITPFLSTSNNIPVGGFQQYTCLAWDPEGNKTWRDMTTFASWYLDNNILGTTVAITNQFGHVKGLAPGTANLKATYLGLTSNIITITVG